MKALIESRSAHADRAGLILLLTEKLGKPVDSLLLIVDRKRPEHSGYQLSTKGYQLTAPDERTQIGILTSGLNLAPAFPIEWRSVAVGVCSPLQWRNRPRFSRGSLTFDCDKSEHSVRHFKERFLLNPPPR